nr:transglycosylase SLT domain-containing protein [Jiella mangrovi]
MTERMDRWIDLHRARASASCALVVALLAVSGCIADGPGGSPLGVAFAGKEDGATEDQPEESAKTAEVSTHDVKKSDRVIARRESAQAAESGTISGSAAIDRMIVQHARENGIPPALAFAVVRVESRYNPRARGRGVYGLSQIKPATARSLGFSGSASDLLDADTNLTYGMRYLKGAWEKSGHDVCRTAMKYKGGHRATRMSASARSYCSKVKAHMAELDLSRRGPALAVPASITTRASRQHATPGVVTAAAFAPGAEPDTAMDDRQRSAPVEAVPRTIRVTTGHRDPDAVSRKAGRLAASTKSEPATEAERQASKERDENLAARFGDETGGDTGSRDTADAGGFVPVPQLRPSLND